jgi:hypothetical protein
MIEEQPDADKSSSSSANETQNSEITVFRFDKKDSPTPSFSAPRKPPDLSILLASAFFHFSISRIEFASL